MNKQEAKNLLDSLTDDATVRRLGTVRITNEDRKTTTTEAIYAVEDVLRLLDRGHTPQTVLQILETP